MDEGQVVERGRWRRRRPPAPGRRRRLVVEYTDDEWRQVQALAAAANWSTGAWVARRSLDPGDPVIRSGADSHSAAALIELMRAMREFSALGNNLNQIARAVNSVTATADGHQEHQDVVRLLGRLAVVTRPLPALQDELHEASTLARDALVAMAAAVRRRRRK